MSNICVPVYRNPVKRYEDLMKLNRVSVDGVTFDVTAHYLGNLKCSGSFFFFKRGDASYNHHSLFHHSHFPGFNGGTSKCQNVHRCGCNELGFHLTTWPVANKNRVNIWYFWVPVKTIGVGIHIWDRMKFWTKSQGQGASQRGVITFCVHRRGKL